MLRIAWPETIMMVEIFTKFEKIAYTYNRKMTIYISGILKVEQIIQHSLDLQKAKEANEKSE